jgi:hypothetical protein
LIACRAEASRRRGGAPIVDTGANRPPRVAGVAFEIAAVLTPGVARTTSSARLYNASRAPAAMS